MSNIKVFSCLLSEPTNRNACPSKSIFSDLPKMATQPNPRGELLVAAIAFSLNCSYESNEDMTWLKND